MDDEIRLCDGVWKDHDKYPAPLIRSIVQLIERAYPGLITAERLSLKDKCH